MRCSCAGWGIWRSELGVFATRCLGIRRAPPARCGEETGTCLALLEGVGGRILIVEDEAVLRKHLVRLFEREGYEVAVAGSCAEALDELAGSQFEALLLDVMLPDGDGLEMLATLADDERPRQTVVMSAFSTAANERRARHLNVHRLLPKPLDLAQLLGAVRSNATA